VLRNVEVTHPAEAPIAPATECTVETGEAVSTNAGHSDVCAEGLTFDTVPPAWGRHFGAWADFREYDAPVPWGFLVHSQEHGAVVLTYSCGASCPEVLALFREIKADVVDPRCGTDAGPGANRIIIVPDPTLDVPVAAAGWGHVYRATCLDETSLRAFVDRAYAAGPEDFCSAGVDRSDMGWCPPAGDAGARDAGGIDGGAADGGAGDGG
jgi:hypothetical protein